MRAFDRRRGASGYIGWLAACAACILFLLSGMTGRAARTGTVSVESARVRQEASTDSAQVGSLASGEQVDIIGEQESGGSTWYNISFTLDGEEVTGWLRSDLLTVTETEDPETTETPEEEPEAPAESYTIQEPSETYSGADSLVQTTVQAGEESFTAWQANTDTALYLVWAAAPDGSAGWYWYDPAQGTFQQDLGQFGSQGLIAALQSELTELKETSASSLSTRLYIIIGLGVLCVILLVLVIVFAVRSRNVEYEYYDEDDKDAEDMDDDHEAEMPVKRGGFFSRRRAEEEEEDDFDDFLAAVNEKRARDAAGADEDYEEDYDEEEAEEEKPDLSLTANLPEIDMSAVEEVEKESAKPRKETRKPRAEKKAREEDEEDDFDIEILDLDDFDL